MEEGQEVKMVGLPLLPETMLFLVKALISAQFLWGNVFLREVVQIDAQNSNFNIFDSILCRKSGSTFILSLSYKK